VVWFGFCFALLQPTTRRDQPAQLQIAALVCAITTSQFIVRLSSSSVTFSPHTRSEATPRSSPTSAGNRLNQPATTRPGQVRTAQLRLSCKTSIVPPAHFCRKYCPVQYETVRIVSHHIASHQIALHQLLLYVRLLPSPELALLLSLSLTDPRSRLGYDTIMSLPPPVSLGF
jgi:hypothetical protein